MWFFHLLIPKAILSQICAVLGSLVHYNGHIKIILSNNNSTLCWEVQDSESAELICIQLCLTKNVKNNLIFNKTFYLYLVSKHVL